MCVLKQCWNGRRLTVKSLEMNWRKIRATVVAGMVLNSSAIATEWPHSRGDAAMTGLSTTELRVPMTLGWQFRLMPQPKGGDMLVSSAVVRGGKVYAGCKDGKFYCLELETGKKVWEVTTKGAFDGAAAFSGKMVVAGCQDGFVYAWDADTGKEVWKFETMAEIHAAANVWTDPKTKKDVIVIGSYDYSIYGLEADTGKKIWSVETGNYVNGGAAIADGVTVAGGCDSVLHVHDVATGKEIRQIEVGAYIGNNVAIADGVVYVSHYGSRVAAYALNDGMKVWEYAGEREFEYYAAPAVFGKIVVVGGRDKRLHGIDRVTGKGLWAFRARDRIDSSAVICAGKTAVFGTDDGYVYAVDIQSGKEVWSYEVGAPVKTSPAVAGDWVIFGADDGVLYAFKNAPPTPAP
jgi:eukaryotic-like serine/threonine-protein kinase